MMVRAHGERWCGQYSANDWENSGNLCSGTYRELAEFFENDPDVNWDFRGVE
jgi:hypothetical protein